AQGERPLVVGGARELAAALRRELTRGGVASAVRELGPLDGTAALVYVLADEPGEDDERTLREAARAKLPIVAVLAGPPSARPASLPYVHATDMVEVEPGGGFPVERIARRIAVLLGESATPLAARLPVLRRPVCEELIARFARQSAVLGTAVFLLGADLPVLTLNHIRLVLRIADAHGFELERERLPEVLGVVGSGVGLRALARQ